MELLCFLFDEKEWIFSGLGLFAITCISGLLKKKRNSKSMKYHGGGYSHIHMNTQEVAASLLERNITTTNSAHINLNNRLQIFQEIANHGKTLKIIRKKLRLQDAFFWIDIDKFTQINKIFGKAVADEVIVCIMHILEQTVLSIIKEDLFLYHAKLRDEFFLFFESKDSDSCRYDEVALLLVNSIEKYNWNTLVFGMKITCSIGISRYQNTSIGSLDAIKRARASVDLAKFYGGNQVGPEIVRLNRSHSVSIRES